MTATNEPSPDTYACAHCGRTAEEKLCSWIDGDAVCLACFNEALFDMFDVNQNYVPGENN